MLLVSVFCSEWQASVWAAEEDGFANRPLSSSVEEAAAGAGVAEWPIALGWAISLVGSIVALFFAWKFFNWMKEQNPGDEQMVKIAEHVRQGARAYLNQQYKVVFLFFVIVSGLLAVVAFVFDAQSKWVPFAFLTGGFFSGLAGWFGMKTATLASSRTAQGCKNSLNEGLQVAFRSGAVMGLTVVGLGLLDICLWFGVLHWGVEYGTRPKSR